MSMTLLMMVQQTFALLIIHLIYTQLGFSHLGAEISRKGNEQLLHNLEEGVIILEEDFQSVLFVNKSAKQLKINESDKHRKGEGQVTFFKENELFALLDSSIFNEQTADLQQANYSIRTIKEYKSLETVIKEEASKNYPSKNMIFKLKGNKLKKKRKDANISNLFYSIKVKPQSYVGKAAIAVYINDVTKKVKNKLLKIEQRELN